MSETTAQSRSSATDKPQNGIAGLKHIKSDILSGIVVSLVSLPLSSGIAIASGAPPIVGLISAILAGLIFPFIGGAYLTISGPAAGLAPALLAIMVSLGGAGDSENIGAGYLFLLCVIFAVGMLQVLLALLRLARFASVIPISVVEGMLAWDVNQGSTSNLNRSVNVVVTSPHKPLFIDGEYLRPTDLLEINGAMLRLAPQKNC